MRHSRGRPWALQLLLPQSFDPYPLFTAMKCPSNSHYELCADTCSLSCSALSAAPQCPDSCAEGCQCDQGFLNDGQDCVPIQKCGCYHDGIYYEVGTRPSWAELGEGASSWTAPHCPSAAQPTRPPERLSHQLPFHSSGSHCGVVWPLPPDLLHPSLLFPLVTVPMAAGKTFVNVTMALETLNPPLAPQVKFWLCTPGIDFVCHTSGRCPLLPTPTLTVPPFPLI